MNIAHGDLPSASELPGEEWFEELALYAEGVIHHSTLSARTFSEVLTLDQQDGLASGKPKVKGLMAQEAGMHSEWPVDVHFA